MPVHGTPPLQDGADVCISPNLAAEVAIATSQVDPDVLMVGSFDNVYLSVDGGLHWTSSAPTVGPVDPTVDILANVALSSSGRFLTVGTTAGSFLAANYKDAPEADWNEKTIVKVTAPDKLFVRVDNAASSPNRFNVYSGWTDSSEIGIARAIDVTLDWTATSITHIPISGAPFSWGVNIQTGAAGQVYAIWGRLTTGPGNHVGESKSFSFSELFNPQSFSFTTERTLLTVADTNGLYAGAAVSYPSMTVDLSNASGDSLYVVWSSRVDDSRSDILLMKGYRPFAGPAVAWNTTNLLRVNIDTTAIRFWPWISWDQCTGMLAVVFMENSSPGVFVTKVAVSETHGTTWTEFQVSNVPWDGTPAVGYDYIGIATADGRAFPAWSDNRENLGTNQARAYVSPFLLWGVDSVEVEVTDNLNGTMTVSSEWRTNLSAFLNDSLTVTSPNGVQYGSAPCSTCAGADSMTHAVALTGPCEPGMWRYVVSSRREGCLQNRTSDIDSFFVSPTLTLAGQWPMTGSVHGCPAGDASAYTVDLGFLGSCVSTVAAERLTLEALPVNQPNVAFFPQNVHQPADSAATQGNGYPTTITERQVGGCSADSADVYLDGVVVGRVAVDLVPNLDLTGDGDVDGSDLTPFSQTLYKCLGDPGYLPCANFAGQDSCVDASDLSALAFHLGHGWDNPLFKSGGAMTKLRIEPGSPTGTARIAVRLEGVQDRSVAGVVLRPAASRLAFTGWMPEPGYTGTTFAADTVDALGPRVALLAFDVQPDASGNVELGTLSFQALASGISLGDLTIEFEDVVTRTTGIASTGSPSEARATPVAAILHPNHPNPFNPRTELRYTLGRGSRVHLEIFDIAGRRIRVLVDSEQRAGEHIVTWDGRDASGSNVGSGLYFYRLSSEDTNQTRKLVVLR